MMMKMMQMWRVMTEACCWTVMRFLYERWWTAALFTDHLNRNSSAFHFHSRLNRVTEHRVRSADLLHHVSNPPFFMSRCLQWIIHDEKKTAVGSCAAQSFSSSSEQSLSLKSRFFSMFSFTFLRLSCFFCMDSFFIFSSSLSSPLYTTSSFSRKISRARFLFRSTDRVWWHCERIKFNMFR